MVHRLAETSGGESMCVFLRASWTSDADKFMGPSVGHRRISSEIL